VAADQIARVGGIDRRVERDQPCRRLIERKRCEEVQQKIESGIVVEITLNIKR
jgi:hypothetical protein